MNACSVHSSTPAQLFCSSEQKLYCIGCVSQHTGHKLLSIHQYQYELTMIKELQSKYTALISLSHSIGMLKRSINQYLYSINIQIKVGISECMKKAKGKPLLTEPMKNNGLGKIFTSMLESFKSQLSGLDELKILKKENTIDIVHYWESNILTILDIKSKVPSKIILDKEIDSTAASISVGKRIFIMGGKSNNVYEVDKASKKLIGKQSMLCIKCEHSLCHFDSIVYSVGGFEGAKSINDCQKISILTDQWDALPLLETPRDFCAVFIWHDYLYAFCGNNFYDGCSHLLNSLEALSLTNNDKWCFAIVDNPPTCRNGLNGISINEQEVIVFGGFQK